MVAGGTQTPLFDAACAIEATNDPAVPITTTRVAKVALLLELPTLTLKAAFAIDARPTPLAEVRVSVASMTLARDTTKRAAVVLLCLTLSPRALTFAARQAGELAPHTALFTIFSSRCNRAAPRTSLSTYANHRYPFVVGIVAALRVASTLETFGRAAPQFLAMKAVATRWPSAAIAAAEVVGHTTTSFEELTSSIPDRRENRRRQLTSSHQLNQLQAVVDRAIVTLGARHWDRKDIGRTPQRDRDHARTKHCTMLM